MTPGTMHLFGKIASIKIGPLFVMVSFTSIVYFGYCTAPAPLIVPKIYIYIVLTLTFRRNMFLVRLSGPEIPYFVLPSQQHLKKC